MSASSQILSNENEVKLSEAELTSIARAERVLDNLIPADSNDHMLLAKIKRELHIAIFRDYSELSIGVNLLDDLYNKLSLPRLQFIHILDLINNRQDSTLTPEETTLSQEEFEKMHFMIKQLFEKIYFIFKIMKAHGVSLTEFHVKSSLVKSSEINSAFSTISLLDRIERSYPETFKVTISESGDWIPELGIKLLKLGIKLIKKEPKQELDYDKLLLLNDWKYLDSEYRLNLFLKSISSLKSESEFTSIYEAINAMRSFVLSNEHFDYLFSLEDLPGFIRNFNENKHLFTEDSVPLFLREELNGIDNPIFLQNNKNNEKIFIKLLRDFVFPSFIAFACGRKDKDKQRELNVIFNNEQLGEIISDFIKPCIIKPKQEEEKIDQPLSSELASVSYGSLTSSSASSSTSDFASSISSVASSLASGAISSISSASTSFFGGVTAAATEGIRTLDNDAPSSSASPRE